MLFQEDEIWNVMKGMKGDKAPGIDGFTISFFQKCWYIIKEDLLRGFEEFHQKDEFYLHLYNTFITLVPKKRVASAPKDLCPISLLSSVYKIIFNVLTSRLRPIMESIISNPQGDFVVGRQILNGISITNECVDEVIKKGETGILCKLDLEKASDHISWNFLDYMLGRLGFRGKWRG